MFSNDSNKATTFDYEGGDLEAMSVAEKYYEWIFDTIRPHIGRHVVEVGAGVGSFSKLIQRTVPKTLTLIEPSKRTHDELKQKIVSTEETSVQTINDYLKGNEKRLKGKVDTFVYINVFEHIKDDFAEIKRIADILQDNGNVIIFVPAIQKLYGEFDKTVGHYRRYDKKRLTELCEAAGLDVVTIRHMDMVGILPWWLSFVVLKRATLMPRMVKIYDAAVVPVIRAFETLVPAPVGKNVLLVAKKRPS